MRYCADLPMIVKRHYTLLLPTAKHFRRVCMRCCSPYVSPMAYRRSVLPPMNPITKSTGSAGQVALMASLLVAWSIVCCSRRIRQLMTCLRLAVMGRRYAIALSGALVYSLWMPILSPSVQASAWCMIFVAAIWQSVVKVRPLCLPFMRRYFRTQPMRGCC